MRAQSYLLNVGFILFELLTYLGQTGKTVFSSTTLKHTSRMFIQKLNIPSWAIKAIFLQRNFLFFLEKQKQNIPMYFVPNVSQIIFTYK